MAIKDGDKIKVEYEGKLEDGQVFDSSKQGEQGQPLEFEVGAKQVIPGFEDAVKGMEKGQKKEFKISSDQAYGEKRDDLKKDIPKSSVPENPDGKQPEPGMVLMVQSPQGQQFPAQIVDVKEETITLDLNHPLAGKDLFFNIEVVDVQEGAGSAGASEGTEAADSQ
ncbi:MAG: peptidylprolyl isomerase [Candidatus Pacearchaeota archaeon]